MSYRIGIKKFAKIVKYMGPKAEEAVILGLRESALYLETLIATEIENAKPRPAVNTGSLKRSIKTQATETGAITSVDAPHASFIEWGTRPHRPPIAPLKDWVRQKGLAGDEKEIEQIARAIADHIAVNGTEPRFYMKKAVGKLYSRRVLDRFVGGQLDKVEL
jgi:hypothetical protein